jgi:hypothetical protein
MANYELHEFDPVKVFTGEIDPLEVNSFKHEAYNTNTVGQIVIDKNNPTDTKRKFISLATKKTSYTKFNQIIDIEFAEFIAKSVVDPTLFLQAKINSLEALIENLRSNRNTDKSKIDALMQQIEALQAQLDALKNPAGDNKISNILKYGQKLIAGSEKQITGSLSTTQGITGSLSTSPSSSFTIPGDRLLSKNRKYVAIIQGDRNFVVRKGEFDERGYSLEDSVVELVRVISDIDGNSLYIENSAPYALTFTTTALIVGEEIPSSPGYYGSLEVVAGGLSSNAKLILEDSGRLVVTNNSQAVRTWG